MEDYEKPQTHIKDVILRGFNKSHSRLGRDVDCIAWKGGESKLKASKAILEHMVLLKNRVVFRGQLTELL